MSRVRKVSELELGQDLEHFRRETRAERVGWVVMALALLLAGAGYCGSGPVSVRERHGEGLTVRYSRYEHCCTPVRMTVQFQTSAGEEARLAIDTDYLRSMHLENVSPEPERVEHWDKVQIFVFRAINAGLHEVEFLFDPSPGWPHGQIRLNNRAGVQLDQVIYP